MSQVLGAFGLLFFGLWITETMDTESVDMAAQLYI
jgi:hypothetical protein